MSLHFIDPYLRPLWAKFELEEALYHPRQAEARTAFDEITSWIESVREDLRRGSFAPSRALAEELQEAMINAIYGSNRLDGAGLSWPTTQFFCRDALRGRGGWITEHHLEELKERALVQVLWVQPNIIGYQGREHVVRRDRNEMIQHAKAYKFILAVYVRGDEVPKESKARDRLPKNHTLKGFKPTHFVQRDLTQCVIKATHRILITGVPAESQRYNEGRPPFVKDENGKLVVGDLKFITDPDLEYAGEYRHGI